LKRIFKRPTSKPFLKKNQQKRSLSHYELYEILLMGFGGFCITLKNLAKKGAILDKAKAIG